MTTNIAEAFSASAESYDHERRALVPCFDEFYGAALDCLQLDNNRALNILDLGAGTGLFAAMVASVYPNAQFRLIDISSEMLEKAAERFARMGGVEPKFIVADYLATELGGPYDAIISALSIHHLSDSDKQKLFRSIRASLKPGGIFVNAEQVLGKTATIERDYGNWWLASARAKGASEGMISRAKQRMEHDRCATVDDQLGWMAEAGFNQPQCVFQDNLFAVLVASN